MKQLILCLIILLAFSANTLGSTATRYVSDAGNDSNNGTTPALAWATLDSAFARIARTDWYFDGYDMIELVLIDDGGDGATFTPAATLEWGNTDVLTLYVHADDDGQDGYDDITISGAREISGWQTYTPNPDNDYATYSYDFDPTQPDFTNEPWLTNIDPWQPYMMRDMLIDDGTPFYLRTDVDVDTEDLKPGDFAIMSGKIFVADGEITGDKADVAVIAPLLIVENAKAVHLAQLTFTKCNTPLDRGMVEINGVDAVTIDTCSFSLSNRIGLRVLNSPRETPEDMSCCAGMGVNMAGCTANSNGMMGMYFGSVHHLAMTGCTTNLNNWNGYNHDDLVDKAGGLVMYNVQGATVLNHTANSNDARGGWIFGSSAIQVMNSEFNNNGFDGLTVASCPGWISLSNCDFSGNTTTTPEKSTGFYGAGIRNSIAQPLSVFDCVLEDNDVQYMLGMEVASIPFTAPPESLCVADVDFSSLIY